MLIDTFNRYGRVGVEALKQDIEKVYATHKTRDSIRYDAFTEEHITTLRYIGRAFFSAIETGRGPRVSSQDSGFKEYMLEYMKVKGIGEDLTEKARKNLAKFLVLKINKEGDKTYKMGGRIVYSPTIAKLVVELKKSSRDEVRQAYSKIIVNGFKHT